MTDKLLKAFALLKNDVKTLESNIERVAKVKAIIRDGKDGHDGRDGKDGVSPSAEAIVNEVLSKISTPKDGRDGRDGVTPSVTDVVGVVLSKIPTPKNGVSPDHQLVVKDVVAQIPAPRNGLSGKDGRKGDKGDRGPKGEPGNDGKGITDVKLRNNELIVSIDGKNKSAGAIVLPRRTEFTPNSVGGGGRTRAAVSKDRTIYLEKESDFPVQDSTTITLNGCKYQLSDDITTAKRFIVEGGPLITAGNISCPTLTYTGTGDMFTGEDTNFEINNLTFSWPNANQAFNFKDNVGGVNFMRMNALIGAGTKFGTFDNVLTMNVNDSGFFIEDGITSAGNITVNTIREVGFFTLNPGFVGVDLGTSVSPTLEIENGVFDAPPGAVGITGLVDSGNVAVGSQGMILNTTFSGGITPTVNIFPEDIRWTVFSSTPLADSRNAADMFLVGGTETLDIVDQDVFVEIGTPGSPGVSWDSEIAKRFTVGTDGVLTYIGQGTITVQMIGTATVEKVGGGNNKIEGRFALNWTPGSDGILKSRASTQNSTPTSIPLSAQVTLSNGDDVRLIFANRSADTDILVEVTNVSLFGV